MTPVDSLIASILPLASAICCALLLLRTQIELVTTRFIIGNLLFMNIAQGSGYLIWAFSGTPPYVAGDAYMIALYFLFTGLVVFPNTLIEKPIPKLHYLYLAPWVLGMLHLAGYMTDGYKVAQASIMHIDGPLSWLADSYDVGCAVASIGIIALNLRRARSPQTRSKMLMLAWAFVPLALVFGLVILLSTTRFAVSFVLLGPMVTLYAALVFFYLSKPFVLNIAIGPKALSERMKIVSQILTAEGTSESVRSLADEWDKQVIREKLAQNEMSIKKTADALHINHTTLRRKIKRYGINETQLRP